MTMTHHDHPEPRAPHARRGRRRAVDETTHRADRRSPASARARSSAAGSSATRARWSSLIVLVLIIVLAATSIGVGPDPRLVEVDGYDRPRAAEPDDEPTMSLRPTWLGGAGIRLGDHPFGLDNETGRDMFAMTMRGVQTTLVVILVLGIVSAVDRRRRRRAVAATTAAGSTPC